MIVDLMTMLAGGAYLTYQTGKELLSGQRFNPATYGRFDPATIGKFAPERQSFLRGLARFAPKSQESREQLEKILGYPLSVCTNQTATQAIYEISVKEGWVYMDMASIYGSDVMTVDGTYASSDPRHKAPLVW